MKNYLLLLVVLIGLSFKGSAQDPEFSQYQSAPIYLNPGFTGAHGYGRLTAAYRVQWPGLPGIYNTLFTSYDHYVRQLKGGIGLTFMNDRAGEGKSALITNRTGLVYAFHLKVRITS